MSQAALKPTKSPLVVTAADLRRTLRVSRSHAHRLMQQAGAERIGARAVRLAAAKLVALLGKDLADAVIEDVRARDNRKKAK